MHKLRSQFNLANILGILGIIAAIYFYRAGIKRGIIEFDVYQALVVDHNALVDESRQRPRLRLTNKNGSEITENVYSATIRIWNSGNAEIKSENIREPFAVYLNKSSSIVYAQLISEKHKSSQFALSDDLRFTWSHFDPGDDVVVQLLYTGSEEQKVTVGGRAIDVAAPQEMPKKVRSPSSASVLIALIWICNSLAIFALISAVRVFRVPSRERQVYFQTEFTSFIGVVVPFLIGGAILAALFSAQLVDFLASHFSD